VRDILKQQVNLWQTNNYRSWTRLAFSSSDC